MTVLDRILRARRLRAGKPVAGDGGDGRDHHGRRRAVGASPRAAGGRRAPRRHGRATAHGRGGARPRRSAGCTTPSQPRTGRVPTRRSPILKFCAETIRDQFEDLHRQGVRIRFVGRRDRASVALLAQIAGMETARQTNEPLPTCGWRSTTAGARRSSRPAARSPRGMPADEIDSDVLRAHLAAPELPIPTSSSARRASAASRTSCSGSRPTPSTSSRRCCGPTSAPTRCATRWPSTPGASPVRAALMSDLMNRVLVALPLAVLAMPPLPGRLGGDGVRRDRRRAQRTPAVHDGAGDAADGVCGAAAAAARRRRRPLGGPSGWWRPCPSRCCWRS